MRYISFFSGIEAATVAWKPLGWKPVALAEIEKFPSAVLKHRFPGVPNLGDMTKVDWRKYRGKVDLVCGGPPCQDFSVAGLRKSLGGIRGKLTLKYVEAIHAIRPIWNLTENVPGWFNTEDNAFGAFLAGLIGAEDPLVSPCEGGAWPGAGIADGPRYGVAWRVLDAQYFGVPQRRRRVFVVGHLGGWRRAAQVLFEPQGLQGNPSASEEARKRTSADAKSGSRKSRPISIDRAAFNQGENAQYDPQIKDDGKAPSLVARGPHAVAHTLKGEGFDASEDGTGRGIPIITDMRGNGDGEISPTLTREAAGDRPSDYAPMIFEPRRYTRDNKTGGDPTKKCPPLKAESAQGDSSPHIFQQNSRSEVRLIGGDGKTSGSVTSEPGAQQQNYAKIGMTVRRLTPRECERLQDFKDDHTKIPWRKKTADQCPDGPRYKAVGNSWAVCCARWIGHRVEKVDKLIRRK